MDDGRPPRRGTPGWGDPQRPRTAGSGGGGSAGGRPLPPSWPPAAAPRSPSPPRQSPPRPASPQQQGYRPTVAGGRRAPETSVLPPGRPDSGRPARASDRRPSGPPPRRPAGTRPPTRRPDWGRRIRTGLVVLLVLVVGFAVYIDVSLDRVAALPDESANSTSGTNYLIVGSDSRADLTPEQRAELATGDPESELTDTIMLLHTGSGPSTLVSIPRDSLVEIPGHGRHKINSAYGRGERESPGSGPGLLVSAVEGATGLHIDHYVQIGFTGFVNVVDAVGGVDLCVPEAITDPKAALDIEAGCQTLDQATALGYVRTRATASSDFGRVERQRAFIAALLQKVTSPTTLLNPFRIVPLATGLSSAITVDEGDHVWNLAFFGLAMRGVSDGGVTTTVPVRDGAVNWDRDRASALFQTLADDGVPSGNQLGP
ncbi:LCP family protein [Pseudonocardia sp. KRD-184]|uniref:LCP family protein n=1 Tax=Pseudonocardia oceani TaxID=2792013 RepID=A0ABS6U8X1_9PSEU|nr:LCP family protein [Pseudonocardia oceani]MBW0100042.1 LCP family protein [Pseudonocardia oceani]MBW0110561.1 LCP family protein [Pseudonocardia oceani]MBW0124640.1 LCP family protein [Pseudonocardia oceani]MBW0128676.1 LCP family protein [Pseudonocardia oceani]